MHNFREFYKALAQVEPGHATPRVVGLQTTLGAGAASDTDSYTVPREKDFYILKVWATHRFTDIDSEAAVPTEVGTNLVPSERARLKLSNCIFTLRDAEREESVVTAGTVPNLASISPEYGGEVLDLSDTPLCIPGGNQLQTTMTLQDTAADAYIGATSVYGLVIQGVLVPRAAR